VSVFDCI